jgi:hypothetical protein
MDGHNEREVIEWGYWTAKFLFDMAGKIHARAAPETSVFGNFLTDNDFGEDTTFVLDNQATILMTAYLLLVYPRELLEQFDYDTLLDDLQNHFIFAIPAPPERLDNKTFVARMRHAVAHANIKLTLDENALFRFWSRPPGKTFNDRNLDVKVSKQDFVAFLARLGGIFVNYLRNHPAGV